MNTHLCHGTHSTNDCHGNWDKWNSFQSNNTQIPYNQSCNPQLDIFELCQKKSTQHTFPGSHINFTIFTIQIWTFNFWVAPWKDKYSHSWESSLPPVRDLRKGPHLQCRHNCLINSLYAMYVTSHSIMFPTAIKSSPNLLMQLLQLQTYSIPESSKSLSSNTS